MLVSIDIAILGGVVVGGALLVVNFPDQRIMSLGSDDRTLRLQPGIAPAHEAAELRECAFVNAQPVATI